MKKIPRQKESTNMRNIKGYIDTAVGGIKNEILLRIDLLDKRDKDQFDGARLLILDANAIMNKRQELVERQVMEMKVEIEDMSKKQEFVVSKIDGTLNDLHGKLDRHLIDEAGEFNKITTGQVAAAERFIELNTVLNSIDSNGSKGLRDLRATIDNVSANGNKGLEASLKDMYAKNTEVHEDVKLLKDDIKELKAFIKPKLAREDWWRSTQQLFKSTRLFRFTTSRFGFALIAFIIIVFINLVSQAFTGVPLISIDHFLWLFKAVGKLFI